MMTSRGRWRRSLACESGCFLIAIIDVSAVRRSCRLRWYVALQGRQRAIVAARHLNAGASPVLHELPGIALELDRRRPLARRARPGGTVVLSLQRHAETFLFTGRQRRRLCLLP